MTAVQAGPDTSAPVAGAEVAPAAAAVEAFYVELVGVMKQGKQLGAEGRYRKLEPVVDKAFNLPLMTQVAVGSRWAGLSAEQQGKLIEAFRRFTIASYATHFDDFGGQQFDVQPQTQPTQNATLVLSKLTVRDRKKPVDLNYVMRETNGVWQVIDVYAEGTISELARRRSEFGAVLSRSGADALYDRLVERAQTLLNGAA